ncbi:MAG: hypothetical protein RLZZ573_163 [Pseudomonadota bacterium]
MKLANVFLSVFAALTVAVAGCSKPEEPAKPAAIQAVETYDTVAAQGKGFTAGAVMSTNTVYVLFDPQCPHCGRLWEASLPLHKKARFVWIPLAFINAKSMPQGAALLASGNPIEQMTEHEKSILAGTGGMAATANIAPEIEQAIKANTALFNRLGAESVPMVVAKNLRSGHVITHTGAMETAALADLLGIDQP